MAVRGISAGQQLGKLSGSAPQPRFVLSFLSSPLQGSVPSPPTHIELYTKRGLILRPIPIIFPRSL